MWSVFRLYANDQMELFPVNPRDGLDPGPLRFAINDLVAELPMLLDSRMGQVGWEPRLGRRATCLLRKYVQLWQEEDRPYGLQEGPY